MRHQDMRADHLFGRRMEMLTLAVLASCAPRGNWHRIAREWIFGDPPVTELGREEAEFYARGGVGAASVRGPGSARGSSSPAARSAGRR